MNYKQRKNLKKLQKASDDKATISNALSFAVKWDQQRNMRWIVQYSLSQKKIS